MVFDRYEFWRDPAESPYAYLPGCNPEYFLELDNVTSLVVNSIKRHCGYKASILEIGCGTGRNLVGLVKAGYTNVAGIEISEKSVAVGRERFPEYRDIEVTIAPIEDVIVSMPEYDVIYAQSCLMHLPRKLDWVIGEIKNKAKYMIMTNERETFDSIHAWGRNYEDYITRDGDWLQIEMENGVLYPPLPETTIKRVFMRRI